MFGITHHFSSGVYARQMSLQAGKDVLTHSHKYDHMSILASGKCRVTANDISEIYTAPSVIEIKAGCNHKIEAIEDLVWFCVHATDEKNVDDLDSVLIGG